jgi:hypothetical protein
MRQSQQFVTQLPASPLSYDGVLVKIFWCVRIRVFLSRGRDFATQQVFQLGKVPSGRAVAVDAEAGNEESESQKMVVPSEDAVEGHAV